MCQRGVKLGKKVVEVAGLVFNPLQQRLRLLLQSVRAPLAVQPLVGWRPLAAHVAEALARRPAAERGLDPAAQQIQYMYCGFYCPQCETNPWCWCDVALRRQPNGAAVNRNTSSRPQPLACNRAPFLRKNILPDGALVPVRLSAVLNDALLVPLAAAQRAALDARKLFETGEALAVEHMAAAQKHLRLCS